jgi:hypothetical protein
MNQRFPSHRRTLAAVSAAVLPVFIAVAATVAVGTPASGASTTGAAAGAAPLAAKPRPKPTRTTSAATSTTTPVSSAQSSAPGTVESTAASTAAPVSSCTDGTAPVLFGGQPYCTGYVIGVKTGAYGTGARVVLRSVTVVQIAGTTATVEGGPSCLSPSSYCGATIPTVTAYFTGLPTVPAYGDVIDLYGTTGTNTLSAADFVVKGHCDPDFGC